MLDSQFFQASLRVPHARGFGLQLDAQPFNLPRVPGTGRGSFLLAREPQQALGLLQLALQPMETSRDLGLHLQVLDLARQFLPDVVHAQQIVAGAFEPHFRLPAALAVFRNPRRLLQENAQFLGLGLDHPRYHPLLDDRVGTPAQPCAEENVRDVPPPHVQVVDVVGRVAIALQHAPDRNLGVTRPLAGGLAQAVVENEFDARAIHRLAFARAVEQHVLHRFTPQVTRRCLAEHPAHGVDHVGLAASVGADDAHEAPGNRDACGIDERLETREIDLGETQDIMLRVRLRNWERAFE